MTVGSILLGLSLLVLVGLFVFRPVLLPLPRPVQLSKRQLLEEQKEHLLDQIRNLDFDLETGKIPGGEHDHQRNELMNQAADVLQQLDGLIAGQNGLTPQLDSQIEAAVARLRRSRPGPAPLPASPRPLSSAGVERFCSQCGNPRDAQDKFCAYCGHPFKQ